MTVNFHCSKSFTNFVNETGESGQVWKLEYLPIVVAAYSSCSGNVMPGQELRFLGMIGDILVEDGQL
jgi:hypothetical protein